jgi:radical SAM protein with 4Fe4S-binding SPASM domain
LNRLQYTTEKQGKSHEAAFQKLFQITPASWKGLANPPQAGSPEKVRAIVEELRAESANRDFISWAEHSWRPQDFYDYYGDSMVASPARRACRFPWDSVNLCPNGDVCPCPDFPDFVAGNVKKESFRAIWNGARLREFRIKLAEQGRFPICTSCCHLYD